MTYKYVRSGRMCKHWDGADVPCKIYGTPIGCPENTDNCFGLRRVKVRKQTKPKKEAGI